MQRWEYKKLSDWSEVIMSGEEGWELVEVISQKRGEFTYFLKRPFLSIREKITLEQKKQVLAQKGSEKI